MQPSNIQSNIRKLRVSYTPVSICQRNTHTHTKNSELISSSSLSKFSVFVSCTAMFRWINTKNKIHLLQKARFISHNRYINTLLKKDLFWKSVFLFWKPVPKTSFTTLLYKHSTNIIPYRKCFTFHNERPDLKLVHFTFRDCYFLRITQNRQTSNDGVFDSQVEPDTRSNS